jgi:hypothetical protein
MELTQWNPLVLLKYANKKEKEDYWQGDGVKLLEPVLACLGLL